MSKEDQSWADYGYEGRKIKSELFNIWKKARKMYDMIEEDEEFEDWVKDNIRKAQEALDEASRYTEYDKMFPVKAQEPKEEDNNYLTNQDKRFPTPMNGENGDQFVTRCIQDANMKQRYPLQENRFAACMVLFSDRENTPSDNPGEKFEDPMAPTPIEIDDPDKPILP